MIKDNLGKSDLEKSTEAWTKMMEIKQEENESIKDFVSRFEQAETELKNVGIVLPQKALAIHIMKKSNLSEESKENVTMKADTDDHEKIYKSISKCMREIKTLSSNKEKTKESIKTYYGHRFDDQSRQQRSRSKSKFNQRNKSSQGRDGRRYNRSKS